METITTTTTVPVPEEAVANDPSLSELLHDVVGQNSMSTMDGRHSSIISDNSTH